MGGSPYSFANQHAAPLVSEENHSASRTLTTNHPSVTGASPEPASSSLASFTQPILAAETINWSCAMHVVSGFRDAPDPIRGSPGNRRRSGTACDSVRGDSRGAHRDSDRAPGRY